MSSVEGREVSTKFGLDTVKLETRAINNRGPIIVDLPFPPSTNNLFANGRSKGRYETPTYTKWKTEAGWVLMTTRPGRLAGRVRIAIELEDSHPRADADNRIKAILDLLVSHNVIEDDSAKIVRKVSAEWKDEVKGARVTITAIGVRC